MGEQESSSSTHAPRDSPFNLSTRKGDATRKLAPILPVEALPCADGATWQPSNLVLDTCRYGTRRGGDRWANSTAAHRVARRLRRRPPATLRPDREPEMVTSVVNVP